MEKPAAEETPKAEAEAEKKEEEKPAEGEGGLCMHNKDLVS